MIIKKNSQVVLFWRHVLQIHKLQQIFPLIAQYTSRLIPRLLLLRMGVLVIIKIIPCGIILTTHIIANSHDADSYLHNLPASLTPRPLPEFQLMLYVRNALNESWGKGYNN